MGKVGVHRMGEWREAAVAAAIVTAVLMAGTGTALATPSTTGFDYSNPNGEGGDALLVASPEADTTPHAISVSFTGSAYTVTDSAGTAVGGPNDEIRGCNQIDPTTVSCPAGAGYLFIGLLGGAGPDSLQLLSASPHLLGASYVGGAGDDTITALSTTTRHQRLIGGAGNDVLTGGSGPDLLKGGPGDDRLFGRAGNDVLNPGPGNDVVRGGPGRDRLIRR